MLYVVGLLFVILFIAFLSGKLGGKSEEKGKHNAKYKNQSLHEYYWRHPEWQTELTQLEIQFDNGTIDKKTYDDEVERVNNYYKERFELYSEGKEEE